MDEGLIQVHAMATRAASGPMATWHLRVFEAGERAAADFLAALGIAIDTEDLRDTPARMARAYAELFDVRPLRLTTFANDEG
jgi:GTP cyclohydrolase I